MTNAPPDPAKRRSLERHLRGLADALLVEDFPGSTLARAERELIATAVSAGNDCFYCMDSHGAFASELLERDGVAGVAALVDGIKLGTSEGLSPKLAALPTASAPARSPITATAPRRSSRSRARRT